MEHVKGVYKGRFRKNGRRLACILCDHSPSAVLRYLDFNKFLLKVKKLLNCKCFLSYEKHRQM
jgi:hypothetical protein